MKIVYVTPFLRVPPDFGIAIRDFYFLTNLAKQHQLIVASFETPQQGEIAKWVSQSIGEFYSLGAVETGPRTSRFALLRRMFSYPPSASSRVSRTKLGLQLRQLLQEYPDTQAIVLNTHLIAQTVRVLKTKDCPVPVIGVLTDIQTVYTHRQYMLCAWQPFKLIYLSEWLRTALYEREIIQGLNYIAVMSKHDAQYVSRYNPKARILVSPNGVDTKWITPAQREHTESPTLLYLANFGYEPNVDGFYFLYQKIMPLIWKHIPEVQLAIVGRFPTLEMLQIGRDEPRIRVIGAVDELTPWYAGANLVVVPLRIGSGVKLKVLEAFAYGKPVVMTSVGAEGIEGKNGKHFIQVDTPEDFSRHVLELLRNPDTRRELGSQARQLAEEKYDWGTIVAQFEAFLGQIILDRKTDGAESK